MRLAQAVLEIIFFSSFWVLCSSESQLREKQTQDSLKVALTKSNIRLNEVQRIAQVGDWELDVATGQCRWSSELFRIFGRVPDSVAPPFEAFLQQIYPDDRAILEQLLQQSLSQGTAFSFDHRITRLDGTVRYVLCQGEAIQNQTGEVVRLIGTARDITDRKALELALKASESRLSDILNNAIAAIASFRVYADLSWHYDYLSAGVEAVYGYTPAEFIANPDLWTSAIYPKDYCQILIPRFDAFLAEQQTQVEFRIYSKTGDLRWVSSTSVSRRDDANNCWIVTAVEIDISDRKQAEIEIQQQRALLRQVIDSVPHHIFVRDKESRFLLANISAAELHGVTPDRLLGHHEIEFNPNLDDAWLAQVITTNREVMDSLRSRTLPDMTLINYQGETRWCQVHLTPYLGLDGHIKGIIGNTLDITDRKQLELDLQASEAKLSAVLEAAKASIISYRLYPDCQWDYLYISPGSEAILGYTAEELMSNQELWASRVVPEDWETVFSPILNDLFNESHVSLEYRFRHKDDSIRWISTELTSRYDQKTQSWIVTLVDVDISDRKAAEIALKASEEQLRSILDSSPYGTFLKDTQGYYTYVNPAYERMSQLDSATLLGKSDYDILPHPFAETCEASDQAALQSHSPIAFEEDVPWAVGMQTLLITKFALRALSDQQPYGVCGIALDITERKQAEAALWNSQQLLQRVFDSVPQSIFWKDRESVYLGCNQHFANDAGLQNPDEVVGKTDYDLPWIPEETDYYRKVDQEVMTSGQAQLHIVEKQHPANGKEIWLETSKVPLENLEGDVVGVLGTYENITQRKVIEEALRYSEARFRAVFEQTTVGIALIDGTGKFLQVNDAYAEITGYSIKELLQTDCRIVTHPDDLEQSQQGMARLLAGEQGSLSLEKRYICKNGQQRWVNFSLSPVLVCNGETLNFLAAMVVDITARKQAEQDLVQLAEHEQAFNRVVQTIRSSLDLSTVFASAVREAAHLLEINRVGIVQYCAEHQCWVHVVEYRNHSDMPDSTGFEIPDADNPFAERLKQFETVRIDSTDTISDSVNRAIADQFPGTWLLTPLIVNGKLWGSLSFLKELPITPFSENQVALAKRFADQLAIAIQQSTLYTQLQAANQQLTHLATHDPLTRLFNRRYLDDYLMQEWNRLTRSPGDTHFSLILCDIDYFKQYNDLYGHPQGDDVLVQVANALCHAVQRPADVVARYGGEEFALVLPETQQSGAVLVVHRIQSAIAALQLPHADSQVSHYLTLSFGIACFCKHDSPAERSLHDLLQTADQALYKAKKQGRNRYEVIVA